MSDWSSDVCSSDLGPHLDALPVGARTRQVEPHGGAVADLAVDLHVAAGLLGKAVDHAEAEAGAVALALGGEEGLENLVEDVGRNPGAVVGARQNTEERRVGTE